MGVMCLVTFQPMCIVAGIWQISAGFITVVIEVRKGFPQHFTLPPHRQAPFFCMFFDFVETFAKLVDSRPTWQRTALYIVLSIPPIFLCAGPATFLGSGALALTSAVYGIQIIGFK